MIDTLEKKKVIEAIGELGRKVTVADVATKTGLPVLKVSQALNQVAAETDGHLQVAAAGDIAYTFPMGFSNKYLTKGIQRAIEQALAAIWKVAFYLFKISFGIMLILSLVIVVVAIFVLMFAMKTQSRDRDDDGPSFDFHFGLFDYLILRDLFYFSTTQTRQTAYDYNRPTVRLPKKPNFLLKCFSFLFGDGNPNEGLDEKRWQLVANVIKKHNGVLTAEQLAPYMDESAKNEDFVLPALVRFNGKPEVTESGNIIYTFPDLSTTAGSLRTETPPPLLREFPWKFSNIDQGSLTPVYIVAALNFFGSWYLWFALQQHSELGYVPLLFSFLVAYGSLFVFIPLARFLTLQFLNQKIEQRNQKRAKQSELLHSPPAELQKKLAESRDFMIQEKKISDKDIIYTTDKDSRDQDQPDDLDLKFKKIEDNTFDASP